MSLDWYYFLGVGLLIVEIILMFCGLGQYVVLFTPILVTIFGTLILYEVKKKNKNEDEKGDDK